MFAHIIVDINHSAVDQSFDYIVPESMSHLIKPGMRVLVPFGAQKRMGIVTQITEHSLHATREIISLLDLEPTIDNELLKIIDYLEDKTLDTQAQIYETVMPKQLWMSYEKEVKLILKDKIDLELLPLFNKNNTWHLKQSDSKYFTKLTRMHEQGIVEFKTVVKQKSTDKTQQFARLINKSYEPTKAQSHTIDLLRANEEMKVTDLVSETKYSLSTLVKNGIVEVYDKKIVRTFNHYYDIHDKDVKLNQEQENAYTQIKKLYNHSATILLEGVTGSGKTEIFLEIIKDLLEQNKKVLIMVPEIMLVGPMAQRIESRFSKNKIAIYHSDLSDGVKFDTYVQVKNGDIDIIIGTRSSIFLPISNLGMIIMDEEHDSSYIQSESIYYDTRELAQIKSKYQNMPLVLSSATPSIISKYRAESNEYEHLKLKQRALVLDLPDVSVVDMREELKSGNTTILSKSLKSAIDKALSKKEQIMLLINQKGYAPFVMCRNCGYVPKDPEGNHALTYYKHDGKLKSRYSNYEETFTKTCPSCTKDALKEVGVGVEYVYEQIKKIYPDENVLRMDADTTKTKGAHEKLWLSFLNHEASILVGTQMIAKGLDFPLLTVVGILMAESQLKVPTYDANEKAFMLFTQALGRSGRHQKGEVFIQSYDPTHYCITNAAKHDYKSFYKEALQQRKYQNIAPFGNMHQLLISGPEYLKTYQYGLNIKKILQQEGYIALGPNPSVILKRQNNYRFILTIKHQKDTKSLVRLLKQFDSKTIRIKFYYEPNQI